MELVNRMRYFHTENMQVMELEILRGAFSVIDKLMVFFSALMCLLLLLREIVIIQPMVPVIKRTLYIEC